MSCNWKLLRVRANLLRVQGTKDDYPDLWLRAAISSRYYSLYHRANDLRAKNDWKLVEEIDSSNKGSHYRLWKTLAARTTIGAFLDEGVLCHHGRVTCDYYLDENIDLEFCDDYWAHADKFEKWIERLESVDWTVERGYLDELIRGFGVEFGLS